MPWSKQGGSARKRPGVCAVFSSIVCVFFLLLPCFVWSILGWVGAITPLHTYLMLRHKKFSCTSTTTSCYVKYFT